METLGLPTIRTPGSEMQVLSREEDDDDLDMGVLVPVGGGGKDGGETILLA